MSDDDKNQQVAVKAEQVFVVQQYVTVYFDGEDGPQQEPGGAWHDIATVTIPANVPRRIALKQALKDSGLIPGTGPVKLRALDAKSAEVHEPEAHQPPLEWKL